MQSKKNNWHHTRENKNNAKQHVALRLETQQSGMIPNATQHNTVSTTHKTHYSPMWCTTRSFPVRKFLSFFLSFLFFVVFFDPTCDTQITNLSKVDTKSMQLTFLGCHQDTGPQWPLSHTTQSVLTFTSDQRRLLGCCQISEKKTKQPSRNVGRDYESVGRNPSRRPKSRPTPRGEKHRTRITNQSPCRITAAGDEVLFFGCLLEKCYKERREKKKQVKSVN